MNVDESGNLEGVSWIKAAWGYFCTWISTWNDCAASSSSAAYSVNAFSIEVFFMNRRAHVMSVCIFMNSWMEVSVLKNAALLAMYIDDTIASRDRTYV